MRRGVLFINLGTTAAPTAQATGEYLREFLTDPYVIDVPNPMRWMLVNLLIVPRRQHQSAEAYNSIWTKQGSPLLVYSLQFMEEMRRLVSSEWEVALGMRYGSPPFAQDLSSFARPT